jgi:hypothetical protein
MQIVRIVLKGDKPAAPGPGGSSPTPPEPRPPSGGGVPRPGGSRR